MVNTRRRATGRDTIGLYLKSVSTHDLLTPDAEADLAHTIEVGHRAVRELAENPNITGVQRALLVHCIHRGERATLRFIRSNLRLVISIAKRHTGRGLDLLDVIQDGNLGLIRAVEKYDRSKGFKFSTYATWWIRQAISKGLSENGRTIRLPAHISDTVRAVREARLLLGERLGRQPTPAEIADASGIPEGKVLRALNTPNDAVSLDVLIANDGHTNLGDFVHDITAEDPLRNITPVCRRKALIQALATLQAREKTVLMLRFGLDLESPQTLSEVGEHLGITKERVRQIESGALGKLRDLPTSYDLRSLL